MTAHPSAAAEARERAAAGGIQLAAIVAVASIAASLGLRALYLLQPWRIDWATFPMFLGDEGAHGLMAMHILEGARPIFYYGAYYHGAFDAYLTAASFALFGPSLTLVRLTPLFFSLILIAASYVAARRFYGVAAGLLAAALVALPAKFVFEWGTLSLVGYCGYAAMVIVLLALAAALLERVSRGRLIAFGVVAGISIWSNQLSFAYVAVCVAALWLWSPMQRRDWVVLAIATLIGMAPLVWGNIETPFSTFRQLGRKALFAWTLTKQDRAKPEAAADEDEEDTREYRSQPLLEVLGAQPGRNGVWSPESTAAALLLAVGVGGALARGLRSRREDPLFFRRHVMLLGLIGVGVLMGVGGFSGQPVGRYQLPLYPLVAIGAAGWLVALSPRTGAALVGVVAVIHGIEIATPAQTDETTSADAVVAALKEKGLHHGIAANAMYEVIFRSGEDVVLVPLDHSRYRPYEVEVEKADDVFYIYRDYQQKKPAHVTLLRTLTEKGAAYQQMDIGDFHVLYGFQPTDALTFGTVGEVRARFRKEKFGQ